MRWGTHCPASASNYSSSSKQDAIWLSVPPVDSGILAISDSLESKMTSFSNLKSPRTTSLFSCPACKRLVAAICCCSFLTSTGHLSDLPARAAGPMASLAVGASGTAKGSIWQIFDETRGAAIAVSFEKDVQNSIRPGLWPSVRSQITASGSPTAPAATRYPRASHGPRARDSSARYSGRPRGHPRSGGRRGRGRR